MITISNAVISVEHFDGNHDIITSFDYEYDMFTELENVFITTMECDCKRHHDIETIIEQCKELGRMHIEELRRIS